MNHSPFSKRRDPLTASEVFGIQRDLPLNYVERHDVDDKLVDSLQHKQHIVIYGSSKQGKTSLRKWTLKDRPSVLVSCINIDTVEQLQLAILKEAGFRIEHVTVNMAGVSRVRLSIGGSIAARLNVNSEWEESRNESRQVARYSLELDPSNFNDVLSALKSIDFNTLVILEDYHYLNDDVQEAFAKLLKAYYDYSEYCFLVIGVWLDEYRLVRFAGDLRERITPINADRWTREQLESVIEKGENLLGIRFDAAFKRYTLDHCFDSVWVVQRVCNRACIEAGVKGEEEEDRIVGSQALAERLIYNVIESQTARSEGFIDGFSLGPVHNSRTIYKWITFSLLASDPGRLEGGLTLDDVKQFTDSYYLDGYIDLVTLRMSLESIVWFQMKVIRINPIVIDYDRTSRRLNVVDREFLIWLSGQDREELLRRAEMPIKSIDAWKNDVLNSKNRHQQP